LDGEAAPKVAEVACSRTCSLAWYLESTQQNKQEGAEPSLPLGPLATVLILARPVVRSRDGDEAA